jgi:hypothetical protein
MEELKEVIKESVELQMSLMKKALEKKDYKTAYELRKSLLEEQMLINRALNLHGSQSIETKIKILWITY